MANKTNCFKMKLYDDFGKPIAVARERDMKKLKKTTDSWFEKIK